LLAQDPASDYTHLLLGRTLQRQSRHAEAHPHLRMVAAMTGAGWTPRPAIVAAQPALGTPVICVTPEARLPIRTTWPGRGGSIDAAWRRHGPWPDARVGTARTQRIGESNMSELANGGAPGHGMLVTNWWTSA